MARIGGGDEEREVLVFAIVRGDLEVNETKLSNALGARDLRPATEEEIRRAGAVPGYASPVGLGAVTVVVDDTVPQSPNLVAGANEEGFHWLDVNYGRDYRAQITADIAAARDGDACFECGGPLRTARGVEVGNIFQLGTRFSEPLGCTVQGPDGADRLIWMGSYGIGVGRLLACIAELHHDDAGLAWPVSVAPYPVHLVALAGGEEAAEGLDASLRGANLEPLFDDRPESAGVKFADADLIGLPLRLTVSRRSLERGGAELKGRRDREGTIVGLEEAASRVRQAVERLEAEIRRGVVAVPYRA